MFNWKDNLRAAAGFPLRGVKWACDVTGVAHPSAWRMFGQASWDDWRHLRPLHAYVYARWTKQYIGMAMKYGMPRLDERSRKGVGIAYHGKVLTQDQAEAIILLDHPIERRTLEQIITYPIARDLVLDGPPDVVAFECACRLRKPSHCEPTQVCMVIGQPWADFMLEHNASKSRRLTQDEAVELLRAEHERGHLHSAWFKDVMDNRFYAICNCCSCCCAGIEAMVKYGAQNLLSSGFVAQVDEDRCVECGVCEQMCPFDAIHMNGSVSVDWSKCMGCGVCEGQCVAHAVRLQRDERKGIPLDVRQMA
jgi:NAD-dependent dihydropyrimidine dehydrogenase PreA subunit